MSEDNKIIIDYLEDNQSLIVRFREYNPTWARACSKLPEREYRDELKAWLVPVSNFYIMEEKFEIFKKSIIYGDKLRELINSDSIKSLVKQRSNIIDINLILDWKFDHQRSEEFLVVKFKYTNEWRDLMRSVSGARWFGDHWEVPVLYSSLAADKIFDKIESYKKEGKEFKFKRTEAFKENKHKIVESKERYKQEVQNKKADTTIQKLIIGYNHDANKIIMRLDGTDFEFWKAFIKDLGHRHFNKEFGRWEIPFKYYIETIDEFKKSGRIDWMLSEVCRRRIAEEEEKKRREEEEIEVLEIQENNLTIDDYVNPEGFLRTLYDFQKEGVNLLRMGKVFLADEQGLGKTTTLIAFCMHLKQFENIQQVLVVCPNTIKYTSWKDDFKESTNVPDVVVVNGNDKYDKRVIAIKAKAFLTVINYEAVRGHVDRFVMEKDKDGNKTFKKVGNMDFPKYDVVILDEAHRIGNYKTQVAKAVNRLLTDRKLIATGTPIMNKPENLASPLFWVKPSLFGYNRFKNSYQMYQFFLDRYCEMEKVPTKNYRLIKDSEGKIKKKRIYVNKIKSYKNLTELQKKLDSIMIRRLKKDVLKELPPKIFQPRYIDLYPEQSKLYNDAIRDAFLYINGKEYNNQTMLTKLTRLKQICAGLEIFGLEACSAKADALAIEMEEIIYEDIEDSNKVIIFTEFTEVIDKILIPRFKEYNPVIITGDVKDPEQRARLVDKFQHDINCKLFMGTDKACHAGLTLTAGNFVYIFDPSFEFGIYDQAIDRVHRIGQWRSPLIRDMIARETIEEPLFMMLKEKRKKSAYIVDKEMETSVKDIENASLSLGKKEILKLLSF